MTLFRVNKLKSMSKKFNQFTLTQNLSSGTQFLIGYSNDPFNQEIRIPIETFFTGNTVEIPSSITGDINIISGDIYNAQVDLLFLSGRMNDLESSVSGIGTISGNLGVASVFGRAGIIVARTGDYDVSKITDNSLFYAITNESNVKGALNYIYNWNTSLENRLGGVSGMTEISQDEIFAPWTQSGLKNYSPEDIYEMIRLHGSGMPSSFSGYALQNVGAGGIRRTSVIGTPPSVGNYSIDFRYDFTTDSRELGKYAVVLAGGNNCPQGNYGAIINGINNEIIGSGSEFGMICNGYQNIITSGYDCYARYNFIGNGYSNAIGAIGSLNSSDYDTVVNGFYNNVIQKYNSLLFASNCNIYGNKTAILHGENISTNTKNATILRANKVDQINDRELILDAGPFDYNGNHGQYFDSHITLTKFVPAGQDQFLRIADYPIDSTIYISPESEDPLYLKTNLTYFLYGKIYCRATGSTLHASVWDFQTIASNHTNGIKLSGVNITNIYMSPSLVSGFSGINSTPEVFLIPVDPTTAYLNISCKTDNIHDLFYLASLNMVKITC